MRRNRRKAVAVLDDGGRQATLFDPFAAALRRRGLHAVRLTIEPASLARALRDRLFYSEVLRLRPEQAGAAIRRLLERYEIVDVQFGEATLADLGATSEAVLALAPLALSRARASPAPAFDKFAVNATLAAVGLLTPPQVPGADSAAAAQALGLPLMVKRKIAEGGRGVRQAGSVREAEAILADWRSDPEDIFFQAHIPGELVMYGALIGEDGPRVERCFRATRFQKTLGPSARVVVHTDPSVTAAGRAVAAALELRGLVQFDFIEDAAGRLWHIDANARCWGSMLAADAVGAGFLQAYARLLAGEPRGMPVVSREAAEVTVQPHGLLAAAATGSWGAWVGEWPGFARFCRAGPGPVYAVVIGVKAAGLLAATLAARWLTAARLRSAGRRAPRPGAPRSPPARRTSGHR